MSLSSRTWLNIISGERHGLFASLIRGLLAFISIFYVSAVYVRNKLYDWKWLREYQAPVPVVVVGNVTAGGTGKTPAVEYIARFYQQQGRKVAILSRGYKADSGCNDEGLLLKDNLPDVPHLQDANRIRLARKAVELQRDLLILDDGFQHRRLKRDLDIVLIDATNPWGFYTCLPRGLLREPASALHRAGVVIITRTDQVHEMQRQAIRNEIKEFAPDCLLIESQHIPQYLHNNKHRIPLETLRSQPAAVICGIGNPQSFMTTLNDLGAQTIDQKIFPDHYRYQCEDITVLERWAHSLPVDTWLVTTQKDWVKLRVDSLGQRPLWSLRIALEITQGKEALHASLLRVVKLAAVPTALPARAVA